jgi:hypothetical protein
MRIFGPAEHVHVENEWYDGPRAGIADVGGLPHRFASQWDDDEEDYLGTFLVWPVAPAELALEREQWAIFVAWNDRYEAGAVRTDSHPGHVGTNPRWDEVCDPRSGQAPIGGPATQPASSPAPRLSAGAFPHSLGRKRK